MSNPSSQSGRGGDPIYWLIAIGLLLTGFAAPVGIVMIVLKLLGGKKRGRHPYYSQQQQVNMGARTTAAQEPFSQPEHTAPKGGKTAKKRPQSSSPLLQLSQQGKRLTRIGAIISAVLAFTIIATLSNAAYWLFNGEPAWFFQDALEMLPFLCGLGGSLGCLWAGLRKQKQAARYRNYLAMIGKHSSISISALASATGSSPRQVRDDLEDMLEDGLFPGGFLDLGGDRLVVSGDGLEDTPPPKEELPKEPAPHEEENAILAEIRAVNDAVDNEKLSAQIDRIGVITAKILEYQRSHPEKSPQLHSFLSYYLPTTLKILRAYGQLEDQEVSGSNITAAMNRIEGMMDKVVEGFEKQLDQLFQGDAMDITADVEVLERMLAKDGLSEKQGFTLGL